MSVIVLVWAGTFALMI
ncbi:membrane protein YpdK [Enterobacter dykesii]